LYNGILDRVAEREGLEYWVAQQNAESSFNNIVQDFMLAEEAVAALQAMGNDNATFVDTLYQSTLGRAADESGRDYWLEILLDNNGDRSEVARWFVQSQEYVNASPPLVNGNKLLAWGVNLEQMEMRSLGFNPGISVEQEPLAETLVRLYTGLIGEAPDEAAFGEWLESGQAPEALAASLLESEDLLTTGEPIDFEALIDTLYERVLNRSPDTAGEQYWQEVLQNGDADLIELVLAFTESDEHQQLSRSEVDNYLDAANLVGVETDLESYLFG
tara:strand:+ start:571 stop:1389 length:819 start_codon:yes stop_codon:yes gene_type:complete